jgi:hypothetical protein
VAEQDRKTVGELAAMTEDERYEYFLAHPLEGADPADAEFLARHSARSIPLVATYDAEQAAKREARRAS